MIFKKKPSLIDTHITWVFIFYPKVARGQYLDKETAWEVQCLHNSFLHCINHAHREQHSNFFDSFIVIVYRRA